MPTYDYHCQSCGAEFEVRMSMTAYAEGPRPACPTCGATDVERAFTAVNVLTGGRGASPPGCGSGGFT
jgi:putative FmdB family regulatory protein